METECSCTNEEMSIATFQGGTEGGREGGREEREGGRKGGEGGRRGREEREERREGGEGGRERVLISSSLVHLCIVLLQL